MKKIILLSFCCLAFSAFGEKYKPTVDSLQNYQVPEWYQDAKFGIWPHWGVYSVPAYRGVHAAEWYGIWMYCIEKEPETIKLSPKKRWNDYYDLLGLDTAAHHRKTYGDPHEFGYHDFVPMFKAEKWDPEVWAQMAEDAGAKFFCMMAMHHDGFAMYDSELTRWNSVNMGPKRDIVGEIQKAVKKRGLHFGVSNHFAWNHGYFKYYHNNGFAKGQEDLADFYSNGVVDEAYLKRWWDRTTEVVDKYHPDLYYFDWGWHDQPWLDGHYHEKFAAYLYNSGLEDGKGTMGNPGVVLNSKFRQMNNYCVQDIERGRMSNKSSKVWQTDTSISVHSWGYSTQDEYYSSDYLIHSLIDIVSKNGILMLNFGPKSDGTVTEDYLNPLMDMGKWLKINGEAIYSTRPYEVFGEGPATKFRSNNHADTPVYTGQDIRFTRSKDNKTLYSIALDWPGEKLLVKTLAKADLSNVKSVKMIGVDGELEWKQTPEGMEIIMPAKPNYGIAYPVRIEFTEKMASLAK